MVLICISLTISDTELFFHTSIDHLYVLFGEVFIQVLSLFFNLIVCLPGVELYKFFINLVINLLSDESLANVFSHTVVFLFILLMVSFSVQKIFSLM